MASAENIWYWGNLLKAVQSFYSESRACVKGESDMSDWFGVEVGLRKGCVMPTWLFNLFFFYTRGFFPFGGT